MRSELSLKTVAAFLVWAVLLTGVPPVALAEKSSLFSRALAAYHDRRLDESFRLAKQAAYESPNHVDAHVLLGELYYLRQDLRRAESSWKKALKLAPSRQDVQSRLQKLQKESSVEKSLSRSDTHPFVVRFGAGQVPVQLSSLKKLLRDAYRKVGQKFEYFPDHPITVLMYPEADFEKVKGISHRVGGLYDGKIRLPLKGRRTTGAELKRVLWHEYAHALIHDLSKGRCPRWLNEGIATAIESQVKTVDVRVARAVFRQKKMPPWATLWGTGAEGYAKGSAQLNYQMAYLVAAYLVRRWSWRDLVGLLKKFGEGYPINDALKAQYRLRPEIIEQEWRAWLKRKL